MNEFRPTGGFITGASDLGPEGPTAGSMSLRVRQPRHAPAPAGVP